MQRRTHDIGAARRYGFLAMLGASLAMGLAFVTATPATAAPSHSSAPASFADDDATAQVGPNFPSVAEAATLLTEQVGEDQAATFAQARRRPTREDRGDQPPAGGVVREYRGFYTDLTLGGSLSSIGALDPGLAFHASGGYFVDFVRTEIDLGFRYHDIDTANDSGDVLIFTAMAVGVVDIDIDRILPATDIYAGGGLGVGIARANVDEFDDRETGIAFQAKGGVSHRLRANLHMLLGYRWLLIDFPEMGHEQFHTIELGVRVRF